MNLIELTGRDKNHLVQLCLPIEKAKGKLEFPVLASEKLDGVYGLIVVKDKVVKIFSRTGEEYLSLKHIKDELVALVGHLDNIVLIAELYNPKLDQPTISGACRDTKHQHLEIGAYIHDMMTLEEFVAGRTTNNFNLRYRNLRLVFHATEKFIELKHIYLVPQGYIENRDQLDFFAQRIWSQGGEGAVAITLNSQYQAGKRNASMVKLKEGVSFDLRVVNIQEGLGKFEHMVGNLICQDATGKQVNVGSGLSNVERKAWYKKPEAIIGKIVQVSAMAISTKGVLREPRFKGIRHDKQQEDTIC